MIDLQIIVYFTLIMTFASFWIHRSPWLWAPFLAVSIILAVQSGVANIYSLIPIGLLLLFHLLYQREPKGLERIAYFSIITAISVCLIFHWIPFFCNWNISGNLWLNYDVPFIGIFILGLQLPLLRSRPEWTKMLIKTIPLAAAGIGILTLVSVKSGAVCIDPKWPSHFFVRLAANLFLVSIPEEAFFRGFVQRELFKWFGGQWKAHFASVAIAAAFFTLMHLKWTQSYAMLGFVFLAGLLYGGIYQFTKNIEGSIICHFALNVTHMVFFTYPAM